MTIDQLKTYKRILILGYGKEGKATEEFLRRYVPEAEVTHADQSDGEDYLEKQHDADLVIKTPGIPARLVTVSYTTATNMFFANLDQFSPSARTIGVTGSKGKSTTASLIHAILLEDGKKSHLIGNIGKPMLEELLLPLGEDEWFVIELSSYQLEDSRYAPHLAVFLSFFPEHLNYHGNLETYFNGKARITLLQHDGDTFVYNPDDPRIVALVERTSAKTIPFTGSVPFPMDKVKLMGEHNRSNIRAALTVAGVLDIPGDVVQRAVEAFVPLRHRLQPVGEFQGIWFYDDAIACAPDAVIVALQTLMDVDTLFLGGQDRGLSYTQMATAICVSHVRNLVVFPDAGAKMMAELKKVCERSFAVLETESMEEAVKFAYAHTEKGKICLMAMGAPSYSLWKDFEEKGDEFQRWVREMGKN